MKREGLALSLRFLHFYAALLQPINHFTTIQTEAAVEIPLGHELAFEILMVSIGFEPAMVDLFLRWPLAQHVTQDAGCLQKNADSLSQVGRAGAFVAVASLRAKPLGLCSTTCRKACDFPEGRITSTLPSGSPR